MKNILKFLVVAMFFIPNVVFADNTYQSTNLEETFKQEALLKDEEGNAVFVYDLSGYKESDDQITIYLFRGNGCGYCNKFLTFLNSIIPEYGKYFKLESYEVWGNKNNGELLEKVGDFLEEDIGGVPFIVIGDQVFPGYASQFDERIKQAILDLYNSEDRYDVMEEMEKAEKIAKIKTIAPYVIMVVVAGGSFVYTFLSSQKLNSKINKLNEEIENIKKVQAETKKEAEAVKTKKTTKKVTKKTTKKTDEK